MAISVEQLMTVLYLLIGWCTVCSILLILARRDVKLGLKKWWLMKRNRQPIKLRYYGPDLNVHERVIATRGCGDSITVDDKMGFFGSSKSGSTFFLDEKAIRRCDDGVNEINYSYHSVMPIVPDTTSEALESEKVGVVQSLQEEKVDEKEPELGPVEIDQLFQYTDPKRLNRLIEFITLSAKAAALSETQDVLKYVKYTLVAAGGAVLMGGLIWYTLDGDVIPKLQAIQGAVSGIGSTILNV